MNQKIFIFASDLAIVTKANKYRKISDILLKLWSKNYQEDYHHILKLLKKRNLELVPEETSMECIKRITSNFNVDVDNNLQTCLRSNSVADLSKKRETILAECASKMPKTDFNQLKKSLYDISNTNFGTKHENSALNVYRKTKKCNVITLDKFFKKSIVEHKNINWVLGGKIDGIREDRVLVEIKNRANKLFYQLREYEKVQVYAYMYLLNIKKAHLVEALKKDDTIDINILEIEYDSKYWEQEILSKVCRFIKFFHKFLKNDEMKIMLLTDKIKELDKIIDNYIIVK